MNMKSGVMQIAITNILIFIICSTTFIQSDDIYNTFAVYSISSDNFFFFQLISYQFLHSSLEHLFFNIVFLFIFAVTVESKFGAKKTWSFYLLFGMLACILEFLVNPYQSAIIGSSGSIFGLMVLSALIHPFRKVKFGFTIYYSIVILVLVISELISAIFDNQDQIAHFTHLGGALAAVILYLTLKIKSKFSL